MQKIRISLILFVCALVAYGAILECTYKTNQEIENNFVKSEIEEQVMPHAKKVKSSPTTTTEYVSEEESSVSYKPIYKEYEVIATAYCPCVECSEGYGDMTATGTRAKENHTIAVDPQFIPYGTEVLIEGKKYIAEDCGAQIKGNKIDIFFNSHESTEIFGVKNIKILIPC